MVELRQQAPAAAPQAHSPATAPQRLGTSLVAIAWRNLWRNRRRTWLSAGGIAFAVWMLVLSLSMQAGSFEAMIDNGSRLLLGHVQIQHPDYQDDPKIEYTLSLSPDQHSALAANPEITAMAPRLQAFALVSSGDRSFGALVHGVDPELETRWSSLPGMVNTGRYLRGPGEAVIGTILARNIGVVPGDELVLLGTAAEGGVAAAVAEVVGMFETGQSELDRGIVQLSISDFRAGWELMDQEVHAWLLMADSVADSEVLALDLKDQVPGVVLDWRELMPEAVQTIEMKAIGAYFFFALIACIVTFSVVNTFMMSVFERTREFGVLLALGMKPGWVMLQLQLEALWLSLLGVTVGLLVAVAFITPLMIWGVGLPENAEEMLRRYNMPDRMYPAFSTTAAWVSALIMLVSTQIAALIPGLRIRRLRPVEALRAL